jgi:dihydrofolate reductase
MATLAYNIGCSLDGYIHDENRNFDWTAPSAEFDAWIIQRERTIGTYLFGRHLYEAMRIWDTTGADIPPGMLEYRDEVWPGIDKVVYSSTLAEVTEPRWTLERTFDPDAVRARKASSEKDLSCGGAGLAAVALRAGLVDTIGLLVTPVIVGGGTRALPADLRLDLELIDERAFDNGVAYLHYRVR